MTSTSTPGPGRFSAERVTETRYESGLLRPFIYSALHLSSSTCNRPSNRKNNSFTHPRGKAENDPRAQQTILLRPRYLIKLRNFISIFYAAYSLIMVRAVPPVLIFQIIADIKVYSLGGAWTRRRARRRRSLRESSFVNTSGRLPA